jgi:hypothetical protein
MTTEVLPETERETRPRPRIAAAAARLTPTDRAILRVWLVAHVALAVTGWIAAWALQDDNRKDHLPLTGGYQQWDADLFRLIAQHGYFTKATDPNTIALFPGYPLVLAAGHLIVRNWVATELLVSLIAGAIALVALGRLAGAEHANRTVLYLLCSPAAMYLMVGYSESVFLAFAIPAWLAATHGRYRLAALLTAAASLARIDGLFLLAGLLVMALTGEPGRRIRNAVTLLPALISPAAYAVYLWAHTHRWNAWMHAQDIGWQRELSSPITALRVSWKYAFEHATGAEWSFTGQLDLFGMFAMLAATIALLVLRRWPEAVYVGTATAALASSGWFLSIPRALLLIFPAWIVLAAAAKARPLIGQVYVAASAPIALVIALLYMNGRWAG